MNEPRITINGTELTTSQAMTLRVALVSFLFDLAEDGLGKDEHGVNMTYAYQKRGGEVQELMRSAE